MTATVRVTIDWHGDSTTQDVAAQAVNLVADMVLADAVPRTPVDTGTLANSLTVQRAAPGPTPTAHTGTHIHYAPYVEFGTRRMRAQPYLGPAAEHVRAWLGAR